jgi:polyphosphate kinase
MAEDAADWLAEDLADLLDEDVELELEDATLSRELARLYRERHPDAMDRRSYLAALIRLQVELIKLQDWVVHTRAKVVVIFEGRDSAGKGGAIKRISQRLNPASARVALPAPKRPREDPVVLPALRAAPARGRRDRALRPVLVQPRGRRARDGLRLARPGRGVLPRRARIRAHARCGRASRLVKYWFSITDEEQQMRFLMRIHDPMKQWKLSPMDLQLRLLAAPGVA